MNKKLLIVPLGLVFAAAGAMANDQDIAALEAKVESKVRIIETTGLLPSYVEVEHITGDIVADEVATTGLTVGQAVEKYRLSTTLERYIKIKEASRLAKEGSGNGHGQEEPPQP